MRALIIGGAGFIGTALASKLIKSDFRVTVIDNLRRDSLKYFQDLYNCETFEFIESDICNPGLLEHINNDYTYVFHLAAIAGVSQYFSIPADVMHVNTFGTVNALDLARRQKKLRLFVDFSTSEIYGSNCYNVSEESDVRMEKLSEKRWTYASSKVASERFTMTYHWQYNLPVTIIRPFNIYGPGQTGEGAISNFIAGALQHQSINVTGNGQQLRSFCYIDDFIDALILLVSELNKDGNQIIGESFNIGNDSEIVTISSLAEMVIEETLSNSGINYHKHAGADVMVRSPNINKMRRLGYCPKINLKTGLKKTIDWYQKNFL